MIREIVRKELLINLLSLRFVAGLVVSVLMMGLVGYVLVEDFASRQQTYISDVQRHSKQLEQTKVYSMVEVQVDIPPSPLSVFSRGIRDLPISIVVSPYHIPSLIDEGRGPVSIYLGGTSNRPYNPLLRVFASIDLSFVISMILSLFAIVLVFDSFSGEREQGTLKLLLSTSAGRVHLLIGKFFGALVSLAIPLIIGFLEVMVLWSLSPRLSLEATSWTGLGLMYLFSLVFLSSFLALALLVSLYARESSSGLMWLLLMWVLVAIVMPQGGEYLSEYLRPQEIRESTVRAAEQAGRDFSQAYASIPYSQKTGWNSVRMNPTEGEAILGITEDEIPDRIEFNKKAFALKFRLAEKRQRVFESYATALKTWSRMRDNLMRPSLCVLFKNVSQAIAGTNIDSYEVAVQRARIYRDALMTYLEPKIGKPEWFTRALEYPDVQPTEQNQRYWQSVIEKEGERAIERLMSWDRVTPVDLSTMPPPRVGFAGLAERTADAIPDGLLLVAGTGLFLALSIRRVIRYPIH
jgi:ABC-type transport system involved in multi-copper enzyme maturation permease subunit